VPLRNTADRYKLLIVQAASRAILVAACLLAGVTVAVGAESHSQGDAPRFDLKRPDIAAFIHEVVTKDGLPPEQVITVLSAAKLRPEIAAATDAAAEKVLSWWQYRARFVTTARVEAGVQFWLQHEKRLDVIAGRYGIPPEYVIAILGIETDYGESTGPYLEIDTLMTMAFDYPARGAFFRSELREFLLLTRDVGLDPLTTRGSYGGALGAPQFMPSTYRRFAAHRNARHAINLWTDWQAILISIAEFLKEHGWQKGGPVLIDGHVSNGVDIPVSDGLALDETVAAINARGVKTDLAMPGSTPAVAIRAALEDSVHYRVGFKNFYVISRYNPRINYTMAVCDLAHELRSRHAGVLQVKRDHDDKK
jgi:membrane-bound lytic murein transglycosylase B